MSEKFTTVFKELAGLKAELTMMDEGASLTDEFLACIDPRWALQLLATIRKMILRAQRMLGTQAHDHEIVSQILSVYRFLYGQLYPSIMLYQS